MKRQLGLVLSLALLVTLLSGCNLAENLGRAVLERIPAQEPSPVSEASTTTAPEEAAATEPLEEGAYVPGERTDTGYENESLGLRFQPEETMVLANEKELQQIMEQGADLLIDSDAMSEAQAEYAKYTVTYELYAADFVNGGNVSIGVERLLFDGITMEQYIAAVQETLGKSDLEVEFEEPGEMEFCGATYGRLDTHIRVSGVEVNQTILLRKVDDRMVNISFNYLSQEDMEALVNCFTPMG